jgi:hypothetical protein
MDGTREFSHTNGTIEYDKYATHNRKTNDPRRIKQNIKHKNDVLANSIRNINNIQTGWHINID